MNGRDVAIGAVLAFASAASLLPAAVRAQPLGDRDDGSRVRAASGSVLTVRLASNLSTGYAWRMIGAGRAFRLLSQDYAPPPSSRPVAFVGRPGVQSFRVKVTAPPGRRTTLQFAYRRWWTRVGLARVWSATIVTTPERR